MVPSHPPSMPRRIFGFAMLEVLISIVIISVGLLGIARLQTTGLQSSKGSNLKSLAALQAYDMADRLRANKQGVGDGNYDNLSGAGANPGCIASSCTAQEVAEYDQYAWNAANATLLPSGQGTVERSGDFFVITVRWDGDRTGATGTGCDSNNATDLRCFRLRVRP